jgi:hypothetical protein
MSGRREIPVADIEQVDEIMRRPYRYRQLLLWTWQLPEDCSLDVYRENKRVLRAAQPCKYGHTSGRYQRSDGRLGECIECRRIKDIARYRLARAIPLEAPTNRNPRRSCPHGSDTERTAYGHCKACKREFQRAWRHARKGQAA